MNGLRLCVLFILAVLMCRPQWVDSRSQVKTEGIDMALVLDVSGSMALNDFDDQRMRIDVAKDEAIRFVKNRTNDAIALILFAQSAISRVPLTFDKSLLINAIKELQVGIIDHTGTRLATGILTAVNRLKRSTAASKVMIVLTDGEPTADEIKITDALEAAKLLGIKIYTVGIGSPEDKKVYRQSGMFLQVEVVPGIKTAILEQIAEQTGGKFFIVSDAKGMRSMYDTIDTLERSQLSMPLFSRYYDIFIPYVWIVLGILFVELLLSTYMWFGL